MRPFGSDSNAICISLSLAHSAFFGQARKVFGFALKFGRPQQAEEEEEAEEGRGEVGSVSSVSLLSVFRVHFAFLAFNQIEESVRPTRHIAVALATCKQSAR